MDSIKKFFEKKKKDAKFKMAGQGQRLDTSASYSSHMPADRIPQSRSAPTSDAQRAGAAAISRFETKGKNAEVNWSLQAIRAQAKREMEKEKKLNEMEMPPARDEPVVVAEGSSPIYAVEGVLFHCPLLGPQIGTHEEIKDCIRDFLYSQMEEDKAVASCLIIHTCNKNKEKVKTCIETLCKYIENILSNPQEEKFQKIRMTNRVYEDKVAPIEGTKPFLEVAGFKEEALPFNDTQQPFWVFQKENYTDLSLLESLRDTLVSGEPMRPELCRSTRVLLPRQASQSIELPPEFFILSAEELKKEAAQRTNDFERTQMLLTKATRERMEVREIKKYRYSLVRIRFPDGIILQGTFRVGEKFGNVLSFVREHLVNDWRPFFLVLSTGGKISEEDQTLYELRLVPAVVFNFEWDSTVSDPNLDDNAYLTEDTLMLLTHV